MLFFRWGPEHAQAGFRSKSAHHSLAMDTSVDLTNATTSEPTLSARSSTERVVMTEVTMPQGVSTSISETTSPRMISLTLPLNWLRTLMAWMDIRVLL